MADRHGYTWSWTGSQINHQTDTQTDRAPLQTPCVRAMPLYAIKTTHLQIKDLLVAEGTDVGEVEGGHAVEVVQLVGLQRPHGQLGCAGAQLLILPHPGAAEALLAIVEPAERRGRGRAKLCVRCRFFGVVQLVSYFIRLLAC